MVRKESKVIKKHKPKKSVTKHRDSHKQLQHIVNEINITHPQERKTRSRTKRKRIPRKVAEKQLSDLANRYRDQLSGKRDLVNPVAAQPVNDRNYAIGQLQARALYGTAAMDIDTANQIGQIRAALAKHANESDRTNKLLLSYINNVRKLVHEGLAKLTKPDQRRLADRVRASVISTFGDEIEVESIPRSLDTFKAFLEHQALRALEHRIDPDRLLVDRRQRRRLPSVEDEIIMEERAIAHDDESVYFD